MQNNFSDSKKIGIRKARNGLFWETEAATLCNNLFTSILDKMYGSRKIAYKNIKNNCEYIIILLHILLYIYYNYIYYIITYIITGIENNCRFSLLLPIGATYNAKTSY